MYIYIHVKIVLLCDVMHVRRWYVYVLNKRINNLNEKRKGSTKRSLYMQNLMEERITLKIKFIFTLHGICKCIFCSSL